MEKRKKNKKKESTIEKNRSGDGTLGAAWERAWRDLARSTTVLEHGSAWWISIGHNCATVFEQFEGLPWWKDGIENVFCLRACFVAVHRG